MFFLNWSEKNTLLDRIIDDTSDWSVIGQDVRTSGQSFSKLVESGSRSCEVIFYFMFNFWISVSVSKVKVFIKKYVERGMQVLDFIIVWKFCTNNSYFINKKV